MEKEDNKKSRESITLRAAGMGKRNKERSEGSLKKVADVFELPQDLVLDLSRITIVGQSDLFLENHKGIMECGPELIRISLARGYLEIEGKNLKIRFITQDEVAVGGRIMGIKFMN